MESPTLLVWSAGSTLLEQWVAERLPRVGAVSDSKLMVLSGKCPVSLIALGFELFATLSGRMSHVAGAARPGRLWAGFRSFARKCCPEWRTWAG